MEWTSWLLTSSGLLTIGLVLIGIAYFGKVRRKDMIMGIGAIVAGGGLLASLGVINLQSVGTQTEVPTGAVTGATLSSVPANTVTYILSEKYSNSLGDIDGPFVAVYPTGTDPKDPNAVSLTQCSFVDGKCTDTSKTIQVNKEYKVIIDGNGTHYSEDLGNVVLVRETEYNRETGDGAVDFSSRGLQLTDAGTVVDMIPEATNSTRWDNGNFWLGNTSETSCKGTYNAAEVFTYGSDSICYDISVGDASYYVDLDFNCDGANEECRNMAVCFVYDLTNPPESNEYSQITTSRLSGDDRGLPSDITNAFKNEQCLNLGNWKAGTTSQYRFTYTGTEANMAGGGDIFRVYLADLGKNAGRDIGQETGSADDFNVIDHVA